VSTSASALSAAQGEVSRIVAAIVSERDALAREVKRLGDQNDEMCDTIHDLREELAALKVATSRSGEARVA